MKVNPASSRASSRDEGHGAIEEGSDASRSPAKLSGKLVLELSSDQSLRHIGGKVLYIDMQGKPIKLEENRTEPIAQDRLVVRQPGAARSGQDSTQSLDADFPAAGGGEEAEGNPPRAVLPSRLHSGKRR